MFRRGLAALLAALIAISLAACGREEDSPGGQDDWDDDWIPLDPIIDWGDGEFEDAGDQPDYPLPTMTLEEAKSRLVPDADGVVPISEAEDVIALSVLVNSGDTEHYNQTFLMQNDIDMGEIAFPPIGGGETRESMLYFGGTFDGGNYLLSRVSVLGTSANEMGSGLFGAVAAGGAVQNLHLIQGVIYGGELSGGVAGYNAGSLSNCSFAGEINTRAAYVGGLCGLLEEGASIEGCFSGAQVSGNLYVGGFVGYAMPDSTVRNCYSTGAVNSVSGANSPTQIGGFIGRQDNANIEMCYASMEVYTRVSTEIVGGFIGYNLGSPQSCYYNETATENWRAVNANPEDDDYDITGCTPSELTQRDTYAGWDFDNVWGIREERTRGMPYLRAAWDDDGEEEQMAGAEDATEQ